MKTLKVLLQEVVSGIKAWVNSNFAQESNAVHKTGNETITGSKLFTAYVQVNNRIAYRDTSVVDKTGSDVYRAVDTYVHQGNDGAYWGGLKHIWLADGTSATELAVANHKLNGSTWNQGFWAINFGASKDFSSIYFAPTNNSVINLGAAGYQWNNVYAKNYFYNGTAWGLDKANTWTNEQTYSTGYYGQMLWLKNTDLDLSVNGNTGLSGTYQHLINWVDNNNTAYSTIQSWTNQYENVLVLRSRYRTDANTVRTSSIRNQCTATAKRWYPENDGDTDLGISSSRWKTLNGINPGALSLPDYDRFEPIDFSQWNVNLGWDNVYTPSEDGWLHAEIDDTATNSIYLYSAGLQPVQDVYRKYGVSAQGNGSQTGYGGRLAVMIPVRKDIQYRFLIKASAVSEIYAVIFYPCLGNV